MLTQQQTTGFMGEQLARQFYEQENFTILETNWRLGHLEVDLIARDDKVIIFCEVKTRKSNKIETPEAAVNKLKQKNLIRAANAFVNQRSIIQDVRFDIISILLIGDKHVLKHIPDAFQPQW